MSRVKRGFKGRTKRKKILGRAKGFRGARKNRISVALHVVRRALVYSYRDRRVKKREFRKLWIVRINAAARAAGMKYSEFMNGLKNAGVTMDRSVLADLALNNNAAFVALVDKARSAVKKQ